MLLVFYDDFFYITKFFGAKAQITGQGNRIEPEFARIVIPINVNMGWLVGFVAVKIYPIRAGS